MFQRALTLFALISLFVLLFLQSPAPSAVVSCNMTIDPPSGSVNNADVRVDLYVPVISDKHDTENATISGNIIAKLTYNSDPIDPAVFTVTGIEFTGGTYTFSNETFNFDWGWLIGSVTAKATGAGGTFDTPSPPSPVTGGAFDAEDHIVRLNKGVFKVTTDGPVIGTYVDDMTVDMAANPAYGTTSGTGQITTSLASISGITATYNVALSLPLNFDEYVYDDGSVQVRVRATGTFASTGTVTRTINVAPVAVADVYSFDEDTPLSVPVKGVLTNDTDLNTTDVLTALGVTAPTHGTLTLNTDGSFNYTPALNYFGTDSFTYKAKDAYVESAPTTVTLNIASVNDLPVPTGDIFGTAEDTPLNVPLAGSIRLNDTDVETPSANLTVALIDAPAHGTLNLLPTGEFTYTPSLNYNGPDTFTYRANDGLADSPTLGTVTINVSAVNDAPIAVDDPLFATNEDTQLQVPVSGSIRLNDTDVETAPGSLTVQLGETTQHGTLQLYSSGRFNYTPSPNFNGTDTFTYRISDGSLTSENTGTVTITVNSVNDTPIAVDDNGFATNEDTELQVPLSSSIRLNDIDVETAPGSLTIQLGETTQHGTLQIYSSGRFNYTPDENFFGTDTFTYRVSDGSLTSTNEGTVTITVNAINDAAIALADAYGVGGVGATTVATVLGVLANDADVDDSHASLLADLVAGPAHGTLNLLADGSFIYTPTGGSGTDSFTYRVFDGEAYSSEATVTLTILKPGDATGDGLVNDLDAQRVAQNWLHRNDATWFQGDFNGDKVVDDRDAAILAAHWQRGTEGAEVPEPGTLALLMAGLIALGFVVRRK